MGLASLVCAAAAFITGMLAAWYWYRSSVIETEPLYLRLGQIEPVGGSTNQWMLAILEAGQKSAALNKVAARLTAASVLLSAISTVLAAIA